MMNKALLTLTIVFLAVSCKQQQKLSKEGLTKVIAVYTRPDGSKVIDILVRQVSKSIKYDSAKAADIICIDTAWAYPQIIPLKDSTGKLVLDSLKNPKMTMVYNLISKDSVNWKIENISVDTLLKK